MPRAVVHLSAQYRRPHSGLAGHGLQRIIALLYAVEHFGGFALLTYKHAHELHPLCLPQWVEFLVAQMWHKGNARLLDGFIAATLGG